MDELTIRTATLSDIDAITAIYTDAVENGTASYELDPPGREEMQRRFSALADNGFPYIVAVADGRLLGYAYAGPFRPRPAYRFIVENSVYIAPGAKGRGVGVALMLRLIGEATALGFRQMIAVIGDGHPESASVKLHTKLGFRHTGLLEGTGFKHDRWLDTAFMQLAMNGGKDLPPDPDSMPERLFRRRLASV